MSGPRLKTTAILLVVALLAIGAALYQFAAARAVRADLTAQLTRLEELEAKRAGLQEQLAAAQQRVAAAARDRTSAGAVVQESLARVEVQTAEQKEPPPTGDMVQARFKHAQELAHSGQLEEALREYLWCFDVGMKQVPGLAPVRLSAVVIEIGDLGKQYPEALTALRTRRDQIAARVLASESDFDAVMEFSALNRTLGDDDRNMELYDQLPASDRRRHTLAGGSFNFLVDSQRYAAALDGRSYSSMSSLFEFQSQERPQTAALPNADAVRQASRNYLVKSTATNIEVLAGAGDLDHAREMIGRLLTYDGSDATKALVQTHLERAGHAELLSAAAAKP
jgi:hypothetical protein